MSRGTSLREVPVTACAGRVPEEETRVAPGPLKLLCAARASATTCAGRVPEEETRVAPGPLKLSCAIQKSQLLLAPVWNQEEGEEFQPAASMCVRRIFDPF